MINVFAATTICISIYHMRYIVWHTDIIENALLYHRWRDSNSKPAGNPLNELPVRLTILEKKIYSCIQTVFRDDSCLTGITTVYHLHHIQKSKIPILEGPKMLPAIHKECTAFQHQFKDIYMLEPF